MGRKSSRKGISPIIAAVLLIAFTLSIATIAMPFFSNTIQGIQSDTSDQAETVSAAANARLEVAQVRYDNRFEGVNLSFKSKGVQKGAVVDWNQDGDRDDMIFYGGPFYVTDLENDTWVKFENCDNSNSPKNIADADQDGTFEVVVQQGTKMKMCDVDDGEVLLFNKDSWWGDKFSPTIDYNDDGVRQEFGFVNSSSTLNNISIYNIGSDSFTDEVSLPEGLNISQFVYRVHDIDKDDRNESLFIANDKYLYSWEYSTNSFDSLGTIPLDSFSVSGIGDIDHDGLKDDLVVATGGGGCCKATPYFYDIGDNQLHQISKKSAKLNQIGGVGDIDGDGFADDITGNIDNGGFNQNWTYVYLSRNKMSVSLRNSGEGDFSNVTVSIFRDMNPLKQIHSGNLSDNELKTLETNVSMPTRIQAAANNMPVETEEDSIQIDY